ncbi:MAG TPA: hypothetical protein PLP29_10025 [Candidatus Ozemobacteraceae bacterium]|nr:hypothetical protein [Candidatus Ozemobacteraceae bacterium]HOY67218.1 hypothetical protein [Candidatus Ozemobacteraceae bacterium]
MEFLIIVCSSTVQDELHELFETIGVTGYTCVPSVTGSGKGGGTRLNDETWPGDNSMILIAVSADQAAKVMAWVREYRQGAVREGMKIFSLAMKEMI